MELLSVVQMIVNALTKPKQQVILEAIPAGRVLDVGGGGEAVIAQAGGARIIAIDKLMSEIHEARGKAPSSPWMVADATELPYRSGCMDNATAFFSCMYMPDDVKEGVFRETQRVLKEGGEFWIWDVPMTTRRKAHGIRLQVDLPDGRRISTVYGVKAKDQSAASLCGLLEEAGFETEVVTNRDHWFLIEARNE
jgi:SAM-dependent methyltransferase